MTVYLGTYGRVELQRQFDGSELQSTINPSDVNATEKRFSFDFNHGQLLSGDQIEISSTDGSALDFIDSYTDSSAKKFIHVDELDGIRLYETFANAVNGGVANAIALAVPGNDIPIRVLVANAEAKILADVTSYELNTEKENIDTTSLSDEFRSRVSTLMSGSGQMTCHWDYTGNTADELGNYLLELQLRTKVGSRFKGKFYLKVAGYNPNQTAGPNNDQLWYEFNGILTSCAIAFSVGQVAVVTANFVTTGPVQIRMSQAQYDEILQEDSGGVLLEQGGQLDLDQI